MHSCWSVKLISSEWKWIRWRKFFSFQKSRKEPKQETPEEALGPRQGGRHCSRCGWRLCRMEIIVGAGQPPASERVKAHSFSPTSSLLVWATPEFPKREQEEGSQCLLSFIMSKHGDILYISYHQSSQLLYEGELLLDTYTLISWMGKTRLRLNNWPRHTACP